MLCKDLTFSIQIEIIFLLMNALELYVTDEPYYSYTGDSAYNAQYEAYGRTFQLGVQYTNY